MEKFKIITLSLFIILFCSCSQSLDYEDPAHVKAADKVTSRCTKKIQKEHNIQLIGSGGSMMDDIREIFLHFIDNKTPTIEQARKLIIQITEEIILEFNSDEDVRPYLSNYPFKASNIRIMISIRNPEMNIKSNSICFISKGDHSIDYYTSDIGKDKYIEIAKEPYEEAQQKAQLRTDESHLSETI